MFDTDLLLCCVRLAAGVCQHIMAGLHCEESREVFSYKAHHCSDAQLYACGVI